MPEFQGGPSSNKAQYLTLKKPQGGSISQPLNSQKNTQPSSPIRNTKLTHPFHANVERRLRLEERIIGKTLTLPKQEKNGIPWFWVELTFEWFEGAMVFSFLFFCCLEPTLNKNTLMRTISVTVMVIILKKLFWKLLEIICVQSSFSTIARYIDNGIWKTLCSWTFYGHGSTYVLIIYWVNIIKRNCARVENYQFHKNLSLLFEEHFIYCCILLFFTNKSSL